MTDWENREKSGIKFLRDLASCLQKRLDDGHWRKITIGDANRRFLVTSGGLAGALIFERLCVAGISSCTNLLTAFCLVTAGAAAGCICSFFTEGIIKKYLAGVPHRISIEKLSARDELDEEIRHIERLPLPQKERQALIKESVIVYRKKISRITKRGKR